MPPSFGTQSQTNLKASDILEGMPLPLVAIDSQGTFVVSRDTSMPTHAENTDITSMPLSYKEYQFTPKNLVKVVKTLKKFERQLNA